MRTDPNRGLKAWAWIAIAVPVFFLLAAGDLALRSREALRRAEREEAWRADPSAKAAYFEAKYAAEAAAPGTYTGGTAARAATLRAAEKEFLVSESSAKMAYVWYRTAAEDFSFPLNPWAARARARLPAALAAWRAELEAGGIKAEEWMVK
ncbi:MAG: hypothetical protein HY550_03415 [Elusimicrobia bacterium]|nr:hypothetical protein [Elusimicrobiota bacterium]